MTRLKSTRPWLRLRWLTLARAVFPLSFGLLASVAVGGTPPLLPDTVFAPTSFWYTPIPTNAPLHLVALARHIGVELSTDDWETFGYDVFNRLTTATVRPSSPAFPAATSHPRTQRENA